MTPEEFAPLFRGLVKALNARFDAERTQGYWLALQDLPADRFAAAVDAARRYWRGPPPFPNPGHLRDLAAPPPAEPMFVAPKPRLEALDGGPIPLGAGPFFGLPTCKDCGGGGVRLVAPNPPREPDVRCGPRLAWRCGCRVPLGQEREDVYREAEREAIIQE